MVPDWDFLPGSNKVYALQRATEQAEHIIALFSPQYINTLYTHPEWATAFRNGKSDEERRFFPVLVEACEVGGVLEHIVPVNLIGLDEEVAQAKLLEAIKGERRKGRISPPFPGKQPRFFGFSFSRNPLFVGREQILKTMYKLLHQGAIVALTHSLDGTKRLSVGKTQIAIEYVYRYQSNYSTVIWLQDNPHQPGSEQILKQLAALAYEAELFSSDITRPAEIMASLKEWLAQQTRWLLVLDGIKNSQLIADLIPSSRSGHVLITTRERAIASLASLVEIAEQTEEEKALSARLDQLVNSALHGLNKEQYLLRPGTTSLGRAPENTLCFDDPSVSLYHAIITMQEGAYQITDLNSEQGTFVEGRRLIPLQAYPLSLQETIRLGNIWLAYGTDVSSLALPSLENGSISAADEGRAMTETREPASASPHTQEVTPHIPLPLIDNPQQILAQVRNGNAPNDWKVFHSQKVSFQEFRSLMIAMDVAFMRALALVFFLALSLIPLVSALAEDDKGVTFIIFLLTVCVDVLAVAFFVMMMVEAIDEAPVLRMETPQEGALLVLTPDGFVEYVDDEQVIDTVSFGAVSLMQQRIEEDDQAWLDIAYVDHRRGQWTPRAQFGPIRSLTKQIFQAFLDYTERYNHL